MRSYSHLSEDERDQIGILRAAGRSLGFIARALGRAKTTVSRELQRNALPSGGYSPLHAAGAYMSRRRREAIIERDARLGEFVRNRLRRRQSAHEVAKVVGQRAKLKANWRHAVAPDRSTPRTAAACAS